MRRSESSPYRPRPGLIRRLPRQVWIAAGVPVAPMAFGTVGYGLIEGKHWSFMDAFYMTAITLTTVGYLEVHHLGTGGRLFTVFLLFGGVFTMFYTATAIIQNVVSGEFGKMLGRQRMDLRLSEMTGHVIVCGYGRMGQFVCHEFERSKTPFVIIDRDETVFRDFAAGHGITLPGDCSSDEVLRRAGIERRALVGAVPSDADNLYVTLSARLLNPKLTIIVRAEEPEAIAKLRKVGANQVVAPHVIGGHRVAQFVLRPTVGTFLEQAIEAEVDQIHLEELPVAEGTAFAAQSLRQARFSADFGVTVIAIKRPDGEMVYSPRGDTVMEPGCVLIAVGPRDTLARLKQHVTDRKV